MRSACGRSARRRMHRSMHARCRAVRITHGPRNTQSGAWQLERRLRTGLLISDAEADEAEHLKIGMLLAHHLRKTNGLIEAEQLYRSLLARVASMGVQRPRAASTIVPTAPSAHDGPSRAAGLSAIDASRVELMMGA
jgi:hypothetical protein